MLLKINRLRKSQSIMEYAILFSVVVGALTVMQLYLRRTMNARIKQGADNIPGLVATQAGATGLFTDQTQYDPYYMTAGTASTDYETTTKSGTETGAISTDSGERLLTERERSRTGDQVIEGYDLAD